MDVTTTRTPPEGEGPILYERSVLEAGEEARQKFLDMLDLLNRRIDAQRDHLEATDPEWLAEHDAAADSQETSDAW